VIKIFFEGFKAALKHLARSKAAIINVTKVPRVLFLAVDWLNVDFIKRLNQ
jgi:hypothetical protein